MNYEITDGQKALRSAMKNLAKDIEIVPEEGGVETLKKNMATLAAINYQSLAIGEDIVGYCLAGEELAKACPSTFFSVMSSAAAFGLPLSKYGTDGQKKKYLDPILKGTGFGALAVTEAGAGSDLASIETTAEKTATGWVLNGSKNLVTNGPVADAFLVLAWTDRNAGKEKGMTFFLVDRNAKGLKVSEAKHMMGLLGAPLAEIQLSNCEVGEDALIGKLGSGDAQFSAITPIIWISVSLLAIGIGTCCMEVSTSYAKFRKAFGQSIGYFEGVGAKLATMFTLNDLGSMLTQRAAWGLEQEKESDAAVLAACAKLFTSESVNKIVDLGMQIHAGHGYMKGSIIERLYRDARAAEIIYGTSEMMRAYIAKDSLDKYKPAA